MTLTNLFSPFEIRTLKIKNRIVMPPMATNYASTEGFVTQRLIDYYVERAKGGVGYLNLEHTGILEQGKASPKMLLISTDEHAARIRKLVEAVHDAGGKIVVQINHAGRQTFSKVTGSPIVGPSPIPALPIMELPVNLLPVKSERSPKHLPRQRGGLRAQGLTALRFTWLMGTCYAPFCLPFPTKDKTVTAVMLQVEPALRWRF
jgi:hypothetical protein